MGTEMKEEVVSAEEVALAQRVADEFFQDCPIKYKAILIQICLGPVTSLVLQGQFEEAVELAKTSGGRCFLKDCREMRAHYDTLAKEQGMRARDRFAGPNCCRKLWC